MKMAHQLQWAIFISGVPTGIRTPVIAVKGRCPRPLDDGDYGLVGGGSRDRTGDLLHAMQALSQLSYTPNRARNYSDFGPETQKNCTESALRS